MNVLISVMYNVTIFRVRIFVYERWVMERILPRLLTSLSMCYQVQNT